MVEEENKKQAHLFVNGLVYVEEPIVRSLMLAGLWALGVLLALGLPIAMFWFVVVASMLLIPKIKNVSSLLIMDPQQLSGQVFNMLTAMIWGTAPFLVWYLGDERFFSIVIIMLGTGLLQVLYKYPSYPRPAFLMAAPYVILGAWFLYQSRLSPVFAVMMLAVVAYVTTLTGLLYSGYRSRQSIVSYKLEQDKLLADLKVARDVAEKANQAKSAFLANMSHELRTPLNGILGLSDVLLSEEMKPGQIRKVGLIQESGKNLLDLLNDILDISKIEAHSMSIENEIIDCAAYLQKSYAFWKPLADKKQIKLVFQKQKDLPSQIIGDATRLRQCMNNLINNALKFTPRGGCVTVTATGSEAKDGYMLNISIQDTGIGINQENISKLFKPFMQAEMDTARKFGGSGLGLAITKKLCNLMGGDVSVQSILGKGSVFQMSALISIAQVKSIEPLSQIVEGAAPVEFNEMHCLVVEDNEINLEVLLLLLEPYQLDITVARNGQEAINALEVKTFDFVLMDLQMPILGGIEATRKIRASGKGYAGIPIIAMTANAMNGDKTKCLQVGMDAYIAKPLNRTELARAISEATILKISTTDAVA
jgi:signal transduction histidine kinase/CheY-like chemotaxis protein